MTENVNHARSSNPAAVNPFEVSNSALHTFTVPGGINPTHDLQPVKTTGKPSAGKIPAVIIAPPETAALRIAALTLLDRLVIAVSRAGAGPITIVSENPPPPLARAHALDIPLAHCRELPALDHPIFLARANMLVQPADVRRCLEERARLLSNDGEPLKIGVVEQPGASLDQLPCIRANGVAHQINDRASAAAAEKALWRSLTSSADGLADKYFNRPCGRALSKLLIYTPISPNMVSVASILIGVLSAFFFAEGTYRSALIGAFVFQLSAIIDCIDGDRARVLFKESPLGKWIDFAGDQIVHMSVFAGIAIGVAKSAAAPGLLWLGVSAVMGALLSFAVVLRGMRSPYFQSSLLSKVIDAATNRDFSVLVLLLAFCGRLDLFLWMAAIGSHVFWIAALGLQLASRAPAPARPQRGAD